MAERHSLNIAGWLARTFLHSKLTPLAILAITLFGALAIVATPRTYNPDIVVPVINISVSRPGYNAKGMLNQVVRPLEALMASLPGVDHTNGYAADDFAMVTVRFKVGENEEKSLVKVYNQINSNLDRLPPGARLPLIRALSLYDVPILTLTLSSSQMAPAMLRVVADHLLEQLRSVPGVGKTWVQGAGAPAVRVWLKPAALVARHLSPSQVAAALGAADIVSPAGHVITGQREAPIRVEGAFAAQDLSDVVVAVDRGRPIYLRDVARIDEGPATTDVLSLFGRGPAAPQGASALEPAVTIAIARQKGSNGVRVAASVLERLRRIERLALPAGVHITVTRDDGAEADDAVNTLIEHLGISIVAVVGILLIFLGWREASVVAVSIPLILFVVLGVGWVAGQTINRITLFALILSLGLLVDDSIVVIENIHRHLYHHRQANFGRLLVAAADEIGRPTIIATFTVILALLPMAFVTGMMGPFMGPIPFNAPVAMLASLIIAYTVVPYIAYRWLKRKSRYTMAAATAPPLEERGTQPRDHLHRLYASLLRPLLVSRRRRLQFFAAVVATLLLVMLQPVWQFIRPAGANGPLSTLGVGLKMLPDDNVNTLLLEVDLPTGTALEATERVAQAVAAAVANDRYITDYQIFLGEPAPEDFAALVRGDPMRRGTDLAQIRVNLVNKHDRSIGSHEIAQRLNARLMQVRAKFPLARIKLYETPPGPPVRSQMLAALYGPDYRELRSLAERIRMNFYPHIYGMINVDDSVGQPLTEYDVVVDHHAASLAGLSAATVAEQVAAYFNGVTVGDLHDAPSREPVPIILRLPRATRTDARALEGLDLINKQGQPVPLRAVARIQPVTAERPYYTHDQHTVVYLAGYMLHSSPVYGVVTLTQALSGLRLAGGTHLAVGNLGFTDSQPDDLGRVQMFWLGEMRLTLDVFRDLGAAFIVALLLIYLLLVAYYRAFMMPFIVMGAIPLTLIGVFPGHWLMGQPFTATSMIGVIALAGIVVRNSLLLIDFIIEQRARGLPLAEAVTEAGVVRLRPILLTALAIVLGSAIMLSDPVFGGLAISLIFGAFASTVLTLFVIPSVYYACHTHLKTP